MTMMQYAIARHFRQLLAESKRRVLTEGEIERLLFLEQIVERYRLAEVPRRAVNLLDQIAKGAR